MEQYILLLLGYSILSFSMKNRLLTGRLHTNATGWLQSKCSAPKQNSLSESKKNR